VGDASGDPQHPAAVAIDFVHSTSDGKPFGPDEVVRLEFGLDFRAAPFLDFDLRATTGDGLPAAVVFNPKGDPELSYFEATLVNADTAATERVLRFVVTAPDGGDRTLPSGVLMTISFVVTADLQGPEPIQPIDAQAQDLTGASYAVTTQAGIVRPTADPATSFFDSDGCTITPPHPISWTYLLGPAVVLLARRSRRRRPI